MSDFDEDEAREQFKAFAANAGGSVCLSTSMPDQVIDMGGGRIDRWVEGLCFSHNNQRASIVFQKSLNGEGAAQ